MTTVTHVHRLSRVGPLACLLSVALLTACAHAPDIDLSRDNVSGHTARAEPAFVSCLHSDLDARIPVIASQRQGNTRLLIGSADPTKASALLVLSQTGRYTAYQRDAWYDKGRFLDSALSCARQS